MANAIPVGSPQNPTSSATPPTNTESAVPPEDVKLAFPRTIKIESHKATRTDW